MSPTCCLYFSPPKLILFHMNQRIESYVAFSTDMLQMFLDGENGSDVMKKSIRSLERRCGKIKIAIETKKSARLQYKVKFELLSLYVHRIQKCIEYNNDLVTIKKGKERDLEESPTSLCRCQVASAMSCPTNP